MIQAKGMGYFYFDESVHTRGNFAIGALIYTAVDPQQNIEKVLETAGLAPGREEFKSGAYFSRDARQTEARESLRGVLQEMVKIALIIIPADREDALGDQALIGLRSVLDLNGLADEHHEVYLDGGLFSSAKRAHEIASPLCLDKACTLHPESDSKAVLGLQLADLVAHTASIMLLEEQGVVTKTVKAGTETGYDPDLDIGIGFELWTGIRYCFFCVGPPPIDTWKSQADFQVTVEPYGLYISPLCSPSLAADARQRFAHMYLGCIH